MTVTTLIGRISVNDDIVIQMYDIFHLQYFLEDAHSIVICETCAFLICDLESVISRAVGQRLMFSNGLLSFFSQFSPNQLDRFQLNFHETSETENIQILSTQNFEVLSVGAGGSTPPPP